jgi:hypothetical protein
MKRRCPTIAEQVDAEHRARQQREAEMFRRQGFRVVACHLCGDQGPWRPHPAAPDLGGPVCDTCIAELADMLWSEETDDDDR